MRIDLDVFKMGGSWIWRCGDGHGLVGAEYGEDDWRDAWCCCLADFARHRSLYHPSKTETSEEMEMP